MKGRRHNWVVANGLVVSALVLGPGCKEEDTPTSPTPPVPLTITAPSIVSPASGSEVPQKQPTLTVSNVTASDGSTPTYSFEVATDSAFAAMAAQAQGIAQGTGGQTSWQVSAPLENRQYFWRARGRAGNTDGPFSPVADLTVKADQPAAGVLVTDPLTNGSTVGERHGGEFTAKGWKVTNRADFIRYDVTPISNGYVEWENTGLSRRNLSPDHFMLFGMWDPSRGAYRENAFRVHIQKLDTNHNPPYIRLRWIADGEEHDVGTNFLEWDPGKVYKWRIEWGPESGANTVRVFLDGGEIITERYNRTYEPGTHWVELGIAERVESVVDAIYANVRIGKK